MPTGVFFKKWTSNPRWLFILCASGGASSFEGPSLIIFLFVYCVSIVYRLDLRYTKSHFGLYVNPPSVRWPAVPDTLIHALFVGLCCATGRRRKPNCLFSVNKVVRIWISHFSGRETADSNNGAVTWHWRSHAFRAASSSTATIWVLPLFGGKIQARQSARWLSTKRYDRNSDGLNLWWNFLGKKKSRGRKIVLSMWT